MKIFIPISDDELESLPATEKLVPFQAGMIVDSQLSKSRRDISRCGAPEHPQPELPARRPCRH
jgi:hypothetical protein